MIKETVFSSFTLLWMTSHLAHLYSFHICVTRETASYDSDCVEPTVKKKKMDKFSNITLLSVILGAAVINRRFILFSPNTNVGEVVLGSNISQKNSETFCFVIMIKEKTLHILGLFICYLKYLFYFILYSIFVLTIIF